MKGVALSYTLYSQIVPIVSKMVSKGTSGLPCEQRLHVRSMSLARGNAPCRGTSQCTENFVEDPPGGFCHNLYNICVAKKIIWPVFTYDTIQEMLFFIRLKPREAVEK